MAWRKVLLVLFALATTWESPWCCSAASTGARQSIKKRISTLRSNCPTSCRPISIQYPFGIGHGCYLPGFNLICRQQFNSSAPARLFMGDDALEVSSIDLCSGYVYFKLPVIRMGVDQSSITAPLTDLQKFHNFNFWATDNSLFVSGCNVKASLVDLANNKTIIYNCSTICLDVSPDLSPFVIRHRTCSVQIGKEIPDRALLGVRLTRLNQTRLQLANATAVSAYLSSSMGSSESILSWYMDDHSSCTQAKNDTVSYACISSDSDCLNAFSIDRDVTVGYYCRCSGVTEGNPYLADGCKDSTTANIHPDDNCTRKCGSVDIPFPFGLHNESDCYRDSSFALFCNQTMTPVLQYLGKNVTGVDVERGELHFIKVRNASQGLTLTEEHYVYIWSIPYHSCEDAKRNNSTFACVSEHSSCLNMKVSQGDKLGYGCPVGSDIKGSKENQLAYRCICEKGYTGNPYVLNNGCRGN